MSEEQATSEAQPVKVPRSVVRALLPARYSAWLSGDLGRRVERDLNAAILDVHRIPDLVVRRIASGIIVQGDEEPGAFVGSLAAAMVAVERRVREQWPVMHAELGSVFTGSLQVMLPNPEFREGRSWHLRTGPGSPSQPGR